MPNVPDTMSDFLPWAQTHSTLWEANFAEIGLSEAQSQAFKTLVSAFIGSNTEAESARQASKDATKNLNNSESAARIVAGAYVNVIKAFAESTNDPNVYALAGVVPDAPPGTVPPPNAPTDFSATLNANGSLTIRWKASQPKGVTNVQYQVTRRLAGESTYTTVGTVGSVKRFVDSTLPFGTDSVQYIVTPTRGDVIGPAGNVFTVQFGVGGGGGFAITGTNQATGLAA